MDNKYSGRGYVNRVEPLWRCRSYYARYIYFFPFFLFFLFFPSPRPVYFRGFIILCAFITKTITRLTFLFPFESALVRSTGYSCYARTIRLPFTLFQKSSSSQESYIDSDIRATRSPTRCHAILCRIPRGRKREREGGGKEGEDILYNVKSPRYLRITVERFVIGQTTLFIITRAIFVDVITLSGRYPTNPGH